MLAWVFGFGGGKRTIRFPANLALPGWVDVWGRPSGRGFMSGACARAPRNSVAVFPCRADCQSYDLFSVVAVEGDVSPMAEFDDPLPELGREFFDGTPDFGALTEDFDALPDRLDGPAGGVRTAGG